MPTTYEREHELIRRVYAESLRAVEPRRAVRSALQRNGKSLAADGRIVVIAIGKAAPAMALGAADVLGDRIDHGVILTKHGHGDERIPGFTSHEAGHPIPDEDGASATRDIIDAVRGLTGDDIVIALVSGGGSALLELPRQPLSLKDLQDTTRLLLHAGANIHELNAVRSLLSQVKGGGLRRVIGPARCVSLLLSDVLGNDPGVIASGPTIPMTPSPERAREIIRRYSLEDRLPHAAMTLIHQDSPTGDDPDLGKDDVRAIVADNATLVAETERLFRRESLTTSVVWQAFDGDASDLGRRIVEGAEAAADDVDVLLGGGEATVEVTGNGIGGRNTEAALVAAMELERSDASWVIASLASDGQDGASEATGAIADPETCARSRAGAIDAESALRNNDSATFFERAGGLVTTGPSGTNVNDVYIALRVRNEGKQ